MMEPYREMTKYYDALNAEPLTDLQKILKLVNEHNLAAEKILMLMKEPRIIPVDHTLVHILELVKQHNKDAEKAFKEIKKDLDALKEQIDELEQNMLLTYNSRQP